LPSGLEVTHAVPAGEEDALEDSLVDGVGDELDELGDGLDDRLVDEVGDVWLEASGGPVMFTVAGARLPAAACPPHAAAITQSTAAVRRVSILEYL
jgi:hypothetical protein